MSPAAPKGRSGKTRRPTGTTGRKTGTTRGKTGTTGRKMAPARKRPTGRAGTTRKATGSTRRPPPSKQDRSDGGCGPLVGCLAVAVAGLAMVALYMLGWLPGAPPTDLPTDPAFQRVAQQVEQALHEARDARLISQGRVTSQGSVLDHRLLELSTTEGRDRLDQQLAARVEEAGGRVHERSLRGQTVRLLLGTPQEATHLVELRVTPEPTAVPRKPKPTAPSPKPVPPKPGYQESEPPPGGAPSEELRIDSGRMALVIDDCGGDLEIARRLVKLEEPVTLAVLPFLAHTQEVAELAHRAGREVIVHLPMEPDSYPSADPGPGRLLVTMSPEELRLTLRRCLETVPHRIGVNNHMGSRMTRHRPSMRVILEELRRQDLFFLDSRTTAETVAEEMARAMGIPTGRRLRFLDNQNDREAIRDQILQLARSSSSSGGVIGIGHARTATVEALEDCIPILRRHQVELLPLSRVIR